MPAQSAGIANVNDVASVPSGASDAPAASGRWFVIAPMFVQPFEATVGKARYGQPLALLPSVRSEQETVFDSTSRLASAITSFSFPKFCTFTAWTLTATPGLPLVAAGTIAIFGSRNPLI